MMRILLIFCFSAICININAQNYNVALIPDSLKENADAVKRVEEIYIVVKNVGRSILKHKYAYTIFNEQGSAYANYSEYYDEFRNLRDISATLFDAAGNKIKNIRKKDISDMSMSDGFSLATDGRVKRFSFYHKSYPYTVEFEDEIEFNGTYQFPKWNPIEYAKLSVQQSKMIVETPSDYKLRYKHFNYSAEPIIEIKSGEIIYSWEIKNYKAFEYEAWQPQWREIAPTVIIAPVEFEFGGYKGSMATWKEYGLFQIALNNGRGELPENIKQQVHALTDKLITQEEKIKVLYEYLQQNTRYISVQLGIGGLQPFPVKYVVEKKYGDCKALSNYMVTLLKEAGVKAYYTWVAAGEEAARSVIDDFPNDYFNHIITCVPNGKDTTWLECTSQTNSVGYMGTFTGNRKAVMIGDDGGYLVSTPRYTVKENLQLRKIDATINEEGTLVADVYTKFTGVQQETKHSIIHVYTEEERTKHLNKYINLPTYTVDKSSYKEYKNAVPEVDEYLKITSPNYASITNKRLFIQPNLFSKGDKLSNDKPRKFDIDYTSSFKDVDTINIQIPTGYTIEAMPKDLSINNKFGKYIITFKLDGNKINVLRVYERFAAKYQAKEYIDMVKFYDDIYKADRGKMVLLKKEG